MESRIGRQKLKRCLRTKGQNHCEFQCLVMAQVSVNFAKEHAQMVLKNECVRCNSSWVQDREGSGSCSKRERARKAIPREPQHKGEIQQCLRFQSGRRENFGQGLREPGGGGGKT